MSDCQLSVELDNPKEQRNAGSTVTGTVVVRTQKDVRCKGLTVTSYWSTHGRGNTVRGDVAQSTLFQGEWHAGQEYRYAFSLATATWPPTHYGTLVNVSHFVQAQASVPWTTDPKAMAEFVLIASEPPTNLTPTINQVKKTNPWSWAIVLGLVGVVFFAFIPLLLILAIPVSLIALGVWFVRVVLPAQLTGEVALNMEPMLVAPGEQIQGTCTFTPKRLLKINGIAWTVKCEETCVSGSGSNRKTHKHPILSKVESLAAGGTLAAGQLQSFAFAFAVPPFVPPSIKLSDNEINWTAELRIDIPGWPDWVKILPFVVKPTPPLDSAAISSGIEESEDERWFSQVLKQVLQCEEDEERLEEVLEAVRQQTFDIQLDFQGESDEPMESEVDETGLWLNAVDTKRNLRIALFLPEAMRTPEVPWIRGWKGTAMIVGLEEEPLRVMMRATEPGDRNPSDAIEPTSTE
jgi:hypothetical protein